MKQDYKKELEKNIKFFLKKRRKKSDNMVVNVQKPAKRWKTKAGWVYKKYYKKRENASWQL